jgi:hypothetical protein
MNMDERNDKLGAGFKLEGGERQPLLTRSDKYVLITLACIAVALLIFLFIGVGNAVSAKTL